MTHFNFQHLFRDEVLAMSAYSVPDINNCVKLDAMENPFSWPEEMTNQWFDHLRHCPLNRYPEPTAKKLCQALARMDGLPETTRILLGNGSDELIQMLLMAMPPVSSHVLAPAPSFVMYQQISRSLNLPFLSPPLLLETFELDMPAIEQAIDKYHPVLTFIAFPNNPTGNLFNADDIETIIEQSKGMVVIDEAYFPYADASFIHRVNDYENLLVMRTLSKLGLAGLRLGYLVGNPLLLEQLDKIRLPYNINVLTQFSAEFALANQDVLDQQTQVIRIEREQLFLALSKLKGIQAYRSAANFILFKTTNLPADTVFQRLKQNGILIKNLSHSSGLLANALRVTVGKPEENKAFMEALQASLVA